MRVALVVVILLALGVTLVLVWRDMAARDRPLQLRLVVVVLACLGPLGLVSMVLFALDRRHHPQRLAGVP